MIQHLACCRRELCRDAAAVSVPKEGPRGRVCGRSMGTSPSWAACAWISVTSKTQGKGTRVASGAVGHPGRVPCEQTMLRHRSVEFGHLHRAPPPLQGSEIPNLFLFALQDAKASVVAASGTRAL